MAHPDMHNPREVRAMIESAYAGYASGRDLFPKARMSANFEAFPRKTQRVAANLQLAWALIDEDQAYFEKSVLATLDRLSEAGGEKKGVVVTTIGRNAVRFARVSVGEEKVVSVGTFSRPEFTARFEGTEFKLEDGQSLRLEDGTITGMERAGLVTRHSNASVVLGANAEETLALVTAVSTEPIRRHVETIELPDQL